MKIRQPCPSLVTGILAASFSALSMSSACALSPSASARVETTAVSVRPDDPLPVWLSCPAGTRTAALRSRVTPGVLLSIRTAGSWRFTAPNVAARSRDGAYELHARCTSASGATLSASAPFRVSTNPQRWSAESTTALSITGDARFTPHTIAFAGGTIHVAYLRDVAGSVSVFGTSAERAHAQLYRVLSRTDLRLRAGNSFCGKPPTFVSLLRTAAALDSAIILTVYSGAAEPRGTPTDAICASYTYAPQAP